MFKPLFTFQYWLWLLLPWQLATAEPCGQPGQWILADAATSESNAQVLRAMSQQQVVLLGEQHSSAEDHRWQLQVLSQLHGLQPNMAIGLEMVPRQLQPVLDEWLKGSLDEQALLQQLDWDRNWGHDPDFYLPIFHFARMNAIPLLALNLDKSLVEAVGKEGRQALTQKLPAELGQPLPPSTDYLAFLRKVFAMHKDKPQDETHFDYFVEAQSLWDLSMAQVMARWLSQHPQGLVVGILGMGHVRFGQGVAHQLKGLKINRVGNYLTWPVAMDCKALQPGYADALFITSPQPEPPPRLGIAMDAVKEGIRIASVRPGSLAERTGLQEGDIITELAGQPVRSMQRLRNLVMRQPAGTWLPLILLRDGTQQELIIRFPVDSTFQSKAQP